jgi:serine/threonine protein kinase
VDNSHNARLCDFGRAKVIGDAEYSTALVAGCAPYMAPELFPEDERLVDQLFSPSSDIYAFGMLAFEVSEHIESKNSSLSYNSYRYLQTKCRSLA